MKRIFNNILGLLTLSVLAFACNTAEQEVEGVVPPDNNAVATIVPRAEYGIVHEGDSLWFDITVDKMMEYDVEFGPIFKKSSTVGADDIEMIGGVLSAFSTETTLLLVVSKDGLAESAEVFNAEISGFYDRAFSFQLNPSSDVISILAPVVDDYDYTLVWTGSYDGHDFCGDLVDLDMYAANADFSVADFGGATGDCPELSSMSGFPDDTYDLYVDFWDADIPFGAGVEIPYVLSLSNNNGDVYEFAGTFNSDDAGADTHIVGQVVVANGVYTVFDADGNQLGTM